MKNLKKIVLALGGLSAVCAGFAVGTIASTQKAAEPTMATSLAAGQSVFLEVTGNWGGSSATFKFNFSDGTNYSSVALSFTSSTGLYTCSVPSGHSWTQWQVLRMSTDGLTQWNYTTMATIDGNDAVKVYGDPGNASTNYWITSVAKGGQAVYIENVNANWLADSATMKMSFYNASGVAATDLEMTSVEGDTTVYEGVVPEGTWMYGKARRYNAAGTSIWNSSGEEGFAGNTNAIVLTDTITEGGSTATYSPTDRASAYSKAFLDSVSAVCVSTGDTEISTLTGKWTTQGTKYNALHSTVKPIFTDYVYSETGTTNLDKACHLYNYIYHKYNSSYSDINNFANRTIIDSNQAAVIPANPNNSSTLVLGGLAAVAVLAAGAYFFVRKKKAD